MATTPKIIVVGGGLAGLAATIKIAEAGGHVDLFSIVPVKRSHSVCAQGGINAAKNLKGEGDTTGSTLTTPFTAATFSPTSRRSKPCAKLRRGSSICWTAWASPSIARRKACSISAASAARCTIAPPLPAPPPASNFSTLWTSRCAAMKSEGKVKKYEHWEFLSAILDSQTSLPRHLRHGSAHAWKSAPSLPMPSSWPPAALARSSASPPTPSSAPDPRNRRSTSRAAIYANGEFIQVHPTSIPGEDKLRLMSESARGEGGRVWVPQDQRRQARLRKAFPSRAFLLPGRVVSEIRQPRPARRRHPRHPQGGL